MRFAGCGIPEPTTWLVGDAASVAYEPSIEIAVKDILQQFLPP